MDFDFRRDEKRVSDGGTGECEVEVRGLRLDASLC